MENCEASEEKKQHKTKGRKQQQSL